MNILFSITKQKLILFFEKLKINSRYENETKKYPSQRYKRTAEPSDLTGLNSKLNSSLNKKKYRTFCEPVGGCMQKH
jgi:hypothetical protein